MSGHKLKIEFIKACKTKLTPVVDLCIDIGIESDYAIRWASATGNLNICKHLGEKGALHNKDLLNKCMIWAVKSENIDLCKYFIKKGANVSGNKEVAKIAKNKGHIGILNLLTKNGAKL